ncbi:hypothetical protein WJX74_000038 [Apatococcus lobatus]|uniref:sn-1-specific diacylglycerol lipase n=1 Tax=Apatococcus lobatus TaxID=904363 RepID=A0AAW1S590_9CHLO
MISHQLPLQPARTLQALRTVWSRAQVSAPPQPLPRAQIRCLSTAVPQLTAPQLLNAAKLAKLSGACYLPENQLQGFLAGESLQLHASGRTHFTRWYGAEGIVTGDGHGLAGDRDGLGEMAHVIALRGVAWRNQESQLFRLWQDLARFWPAPFADDATEKTARLVAHTGVIEMAEEVFETLRPSIQECMQTSRKLILVGHSLGGALAVLICTLARLRLHYPASQLQCFTYGSPCVLASAADSTRTAIQVLGMRSAAIQNFVLENDPIPRAMLSVDPSFVYLKRFSAVQSLLEFRERWLGGQAIFSPKRFLYENVGDVHLILWRSRHGLQVLPLSPEEIQDQLELATGEMLARPAAAVQALLDHWHGSYAQELENAAQDMLQSLRSVPAAAPS